MRAIVSILVFGAAIGGAAAEPLGGPSRAQLTGTWSFDGTCASGDGMVLQAEGKASYDEWGAGLWAVADNGKRLVIVAEDITEEADRRKVAELIEFRVAAGQGNKMTLVRLSDNATLNALKCAQK